MIHMLARDESQASAVPLSLAPLAALPHWPLQVSTSADCANFLPHSTWESVSGPPFANGGVTVLLTLPSLAPAAARRWRVLGSGISVGGSGVSFSYMGAASHQAAAL